MDDVTALQKWSQIIWIDPWWLTVVKEAFWGRVWPLPLCPLPSDQIQEAGPAGGPSPPAHGAGGWRRWRHGDRSSRWWEKWRVRTEVNPHQQNVACLHSAFTTVCSLHLTVCSPGVKEWPPVDLWLEHVTTSNRRKYKYSCSAVTLQSFNVIQISHLPF